MDIIDFGNKAEVVGRELMDRLAQSPLVIRWVAQFVSQQNIAEIVQDGDCVLLACDNHATRNLVGSHCSSGALANVALISGGNDGIEDGRNGTYGNVQVYIRKDGRDLTAPIERFHPEIANPVDRAPDDKSCLELVAAGAPQLLFANLAVASAMCNALLRLMMSHNNQPMYDEVALDILDSVTAPLWLSGHFSE
jgi:molybdopterin/thiamine biosynthesis adenylyltransferase